jgi:hypothetical protein
MLSDKLRRGFSAGDFPDTSTQSSVIFPNHSSCTVYADAVKSYLLEEVNAGRMDGPFTRDQTEQIFGSSFYSSPLIVDVQPQALGVPDKLRVCRNMSKGSTIHPSANSYINSEDLIFTSNLARDFRASRVERS